MKNHTRLSVIVALAFGVVVTAILTLKLGVRARGADPTDSGEAKRTSGSVALATPPVLGSAIVQADPSPPPSDSSDTAPSASVPRMPSPRSSQDRNRSVEKADREFLVEWQRLAREAKTKKASDKTQLEVFGRVLAGVPDEAFERRVAPLLLSVAEYDAPAEALWLDLSLRPQGYSLPLLAEISVRYSHPFREQARQTLQGFLGEEYSDNPGKLRIAVERHTAE